MVDNFDCNKAKRLSGYSTDIALEALSRTNPFGTYLNVTYTPLILFHVTVDLKWQSSALNTAPL